METGTFRVDEARMKEVLSRYQLKDPLGAVAAWLRCAGACGATSIHLTRAGDKAGTGFELDFDGRPLPPGEVRDVYSGLMAGGNTAGRFLAAGLLALQRTSPASVFVSSGGEAVEITPAGQRRAEAPADGGRTSLRVLWRPGSDGLSFAAVHEEARRRLDLCAADFTCSGETISGYSAGAAGTDGLYFNSGGRRGAAYRKDHEVTPMTGFHPEQDSLVVLHVYGVRADSFQLRLPVAPATIYVNDDSLDLDVTMSSCIRNEKFDALKAWAEDRSRDLLIREIARQRNALADLGAALNDPGMVRLWRARMKWEEAWTAATTDWKDRLLPDLVRGLFPPSKALTPAALRLYETGQRAWWLQDACRRVLKGVNTAPEVPWQRALWEAPVLLSGAGETLGLADLHRRWIKGFINVSRLVPFESRQAAGAVWLASFRDERFLNEWIPKGAWNWV